jgi:hypothetical protein
MLKRIGLPLLVLLVVLVFAAPRQAQAGVRFGVYVGPSYPRYVAPVYPYPYYSAPYAYSPYYSTPYSYGYPAYSYPSFGFTFGGRDRDRWRYDRDHWRHERYEQRDRDYGRDHYYDHRR